MSDVLQIPEQIEVTWPVRTVAKVGDISAHVQGVKCSAQRLEGDEQHTYPFRLTMVGTPKKLLSEWEELLKSVRTNGSFAPNYILADLVAHYQRGGFEGLAKEIVGIGISHLELDLRYPPKDSVTPERVGL